MSTAPTRKQCGVVQRLGLNSGCAELSDPGQFSPVHTRVHSDFFPKAAGGFAELVGLQAARALPNA